METDERAVHERTQVVTELLQARRARRTGALSRPAEDAAIAAIAGLMDRARTQGWTAAFDGAIETLRALGADASDTERAEVERMASYLLEIEGAIVRLAHAAERAAKAQPRDGARRAFLVPSRLVPSLHPDESPSASPRAGARRIEPLHTKQLERCVRDAIEEIATLSMLRQTSDDEAWTLGSDFERRLLESLDALAAYRRGDISFDVETAARTVAERYVVVDPSRWFVASFLLACTAGDRAIARLRELILTAPRGALGGIADALALGSNPGIDDLARSLLHEDERADVLELALRVCLRRSSLDEPTTLSLTEHPSDEVAALAALSLSTASPKDIAPRLAPLLDRSEVALGAAFSLLVFRAEVAATFLRAAVTRGFSSGASDAQIRMGSRAATLLALYGKKRDQELVLQAASAPDGDVTILADHGAPSFVNWLRDELLATRSTTRALAIAETLERLTGIALTEEPSEPGSFDREAFLKRIAGFRPPQVDRIRLGGEHDVTIAIAELANPRMRQGTRRRIVREIAMLRGAPLPIDLDGWIGAQRDALRAPFSKGARPA